MDDKRTATPNQLKVSYYDGAVAFGGSLQVLATLFASLDRAQVDPKLIACAPAQQLEGRFKTKDIGLLHTPRLHYVQRKRWISRLDKHKLIRTAAAYLFSLASTIANLPAQCQIYRYLRTCRPDLLHINNSFTPMLPALLLGIPIIWHMHGTPFPPSRWERYLLNRVRWFVTISDHIRSQALQAGFPPEKLITIQNPAPATLSIPEERRTEIRKKYSIPKYHKLVVHVGRIIPWKGQLEFLKAFSLALKSDRNLSALIVGDDTENLNPDYLKKLKDFVIDNELSANVTFTGQVNNATPLMAAADLFVHSSTNPEPFGLVIAEAMRAETAVIASIRGAPSEIINSGKNGILVDPEDTEKFCSAIVTLIANEELRKSIAKAGKFHADEKFSEEGYYLALTRLYRKTAG